MPDDELDELLALATRLHPDLTVTESQVRLDSRTEWRLAVQGTTVEPLDIRSTDRARARRVLKTSLIELLGERGLLRPPETDSPFGTELSGPLAEFRDAKQRDAEVFAELTAVLQSEEREEDIQKCLERCPEVWRFLVGWKPQIIAKMPIGNSYVTDFVVFGGAPWSQMQTPTATFIEIERAKHNLFTTKGDPSAALAHGQRQLQDWKQWISENKQYVRDRLLEKTWLPWERYSFEGQPAGVPPYGFADRYLLVIGRRDSMSPDQRMRLQQMNEDLHKLTIITYDVLLDSVCPEAPFTPWWLYDL